MLVIIACILLALSHAAAYRGGLLSRVGKGAGANLGIAFAALLAFCAVVMLHAAWAPL